MTDYRYDFLGDKFLTHKSIEEPKVELNLPLFDNPLELDWADRITEDGSIIVKPDEKIKEQWVFNNPEYVPTSQPSQQVEEQPTEQSKLTTTKQTQQFTTNGKSILSKNEKSNALLAMNGLVNRGIDPIIAAGIVGNLIGESGEKFTKAYNGNDLGAPAGGLAGWRGESFTKLKKLAQSRGKHWTDLDTQLDYLVSTIPSDISNRLSKATSPFEASEAWAYYEKYAGYNNSIESARKFQRSRGWSDKKTKEWIAAQHQGRGNASTEVYNLWLANQ